MKLFSLKTSQLLPTTMDKAWDFLSHPKNLAVITPPELGFTVTSEMVDNMYAGMIVTYTVSPILGIPIQWVTEITHVHQPYYFVDEQRFGPYRFWHHQHMLKATEDGVLSEDIVTYSLWVPLLDRAINRLIVRPLLEKIFAFRREALAKAFLSKV